jgi:hypothetical protein
MSPSKIGGWSVPPSAKRSLHDEPPDDGGGPPMMEPQVAKWTRDYITKITFLSHRITAYNKREPVDTVYRGIVLNCSGRLTTFYNLDCFAI